MVGKCISYWNSPFSGAMLVSGRVNHIKTGTLKKSLTNGLLLIKVYFEYIIAWLLTMTKFPWTFSGPLNEGVWNWSVIGSLRWSVKPSHLKSVFKYSNVTSNSKMTSFRGSMNTLNTLPKTNVETQHDGLEVVTPASGMAIWGIYVNFRGGGGGTDLTIWKTAVTMNFTISSCFLEN